MNDQAADKKQEDVAAGEDEQALRNRLEQELKKLKVSDLLLQNTVGLINVAFRRLGLTEETKDERDLAQADQAIRAIKGLLPVLEDTAAEQAAAVRDALSQLQLEYAKAVKGSDGSERAQSKAPKPGSSDTGAAAPPKSKLWTPSGS